MKGNKIPSTISLCSGCEACANACPKDAISMKPDWRGFLYPKVDNSKCINCGLCQKACPTNSLPIKPYEFTETFAFVDANAEMFYRASSGGAFGRLAQYIFSSRVLHMAVPWTVTTMSTSLVPRTSRSSALCMAANMCRLA